jgi:hypothetical protein
VFLVACSSVDTPGVVESPQPQFLERHKMFLTKEQVDILSVEQCEKALKILTKTYKLDAPLQEYMTPELWDSLDDIVNTLLYLEDRIKYVQMVDHLNSNNPKMKKLPKYIDAHPTGNLQQGDDGYDPNWDEPVIAI